MNIARWVERSPKVALAALIAVAAMHHAGEAIPMRATTVGIEWEVRRWTITAPQQGSVAAFTHDEKRLLCTVAKSKVDGTTPALAFTYDYTKDPTRPVLELVSGPAYADPTLTADATGWNDVNAALDDLFDHLIDQHMRGPSRPVQALLEALGPTWTVCPNQTADLSALTLDWNGVTPQDVLDGGNDAINTQVNLGYALDQLASIDEAEIFGLYDFIYEPIIANAYAAARSPAAAGLNRQEQRDLISYIILSNFVWIQTATFNFSQKHQSFPIRDWEVKQEFEFLPKVLMGDLLKWMGPKVSDAYAAVRPQMQRVEPRMKIEPLDEFGLFTSTDQLLDRATNPLPVWRDAEGRTMIVIESRTGKHHNALISHFVLRAPEKLEDGSVADFTNAGALHALMDRKLVRPFITGEKIDLDQVDLDQEKVNVCKWYRLETPHDVQCKSSSEQFDEYGEEDNGLQ